MTTEHSIASDSDRTPVWIEAEFSMPAFVHKALMNALEGREVSIAIAAGLRWYATLAPAEQADAIHRMDAELELGITLRNVMSDQPMGMTTVASRMPAAWSEPFVTVHTALPSGIVRLLHDIRQRWTLERGGMMADYHLCPAWWYLAGLERDELDDALIDAGLERMAA